MSDNGNPTNQNPAQTPGQGGAGQKGGVGNAAAKTVEKAQKVKKNVDRIKKIKNTVNTIRTLASSGPLLYVLFWVAVVILIIIIITGIIMFLVTMPGMVMEKLKALFEAIGNSVAAFFGADTTQQIKDEELYETLDYIENMGWDLKGEGFLTKYYADTNLNGLSSVDTDYEDEILDAFKETNYTVDDAQGVVRGEEENIILAESMFIYTYMVSDNYVYTLKNDNLTSNEHAKVGAHNIANFFFGSFMDATGQTDRALEEWGKGLIALYEEGSSGFGHKGTAFNGGTLTNWDTVKIDTESKKLSVKKTNLFNFNNAIEYSLDGWTGRYGMPLEFLLSVHKATMMPDLAFDMATSFKTNIHVYLHDISDGEAVAAYKTPDGNYITYEAVNVAKTGLEGKNIFSAFIAWIDNWCESDEETIAMYDLGVDIGDNCDDCVVETTYYYYDTTEKKEYIIAKGDGKKKGSDKNKWYIQSEVIKTEGEGEEQKETKELSPKEFTGDLSKLESLTTLTEPCEKCKNKSKAITNVLGEQNDYNFDTYIPYIANVSDHWYRDVYFVLNSDTKDDYSGEGNVEFVDYDYEYESMMKERWTLYETYTDKEEDKGTYKYNPDKVGEFIIFRVDENGHYMKNGNDYVLYDGTFDEARGNTVYIKNKKDEYIIYEGELTKEATNGKTLYRKMAENEYAEYKIGDDPIAVAKKAVTVDSTDTEILEDLGWEKHNGIWSAYRVNSNKDSTGWKPLYADKEPEGENDEELEVKENTYIQIKMKNNISQVGEGQRTETNPEIKKMFLQNKYFRYDGSSETAEIITEMRHQLANDDGVRKFGPLSDDDLNKIIEIKDGEDKKDYKVSDYAGTVSLNTDSLNAFSMLENTHTLDSDYIYRDFKELVVELGYFEKEELTDETPKLLQFIVPEINSANYPERIIDKRENEFGTMLHSEHDIKVNKKYSLQTLSEEATLTSNPQGAGQEKDENSEENANINLEERKFSRYGVLGQVATLNATPITRLKNVGAIPNISAATWEFDPTNESGTGVKTGDLTLNNVAYEVWRQTDSTCTLYSFAFMASAYTGKPFKEYVTTSSGEFINKNGQNQGSNDYWCDAGAMWSPMEAEFEEGAKSYTPGQITAEEVAKALDGGRLVYFYGDYNASGGYHAVVLLGAYDGGVLIYDPGGGNILIYGSGSFSSSLESLMSTHFKHRIIIPEGLPSGVKRTADAYEGYKGNEAVVSPVTGILLEYGTYDEESIDSVSRDEYRVNVDIKYGPSLVTTDEEEEEKEDGEGTEGITQEETTTSETTTSETNTEKTGEKPEEEKETNPDLRTVSDKVGYAKILVLNKEVFEIMDSKVPHQWKDRNSGQGLLNKNGGFSNVITTEEQLEKLTGETTRDYLSETVYGYKEYAEAYEKYGIAGYIIYIDGFKCELPDPNYTDPEEKDSESTGEEKEKPEGEKLTLDTFKVKPEDIKNEKENELVQTKYEKPEKFKLTSKKATERLNVEEEIKNDAYYAMTVENTKTYKPLKELDELIFIKEGTVLGRTYTNKELIEERLENGDDPKYNYEYYVPEKKTLSEEDSDEEKNENKLIGNYLRIIMRDKEDTVIENVEDYMKLNEGKKSTPNDWELFFWLPFESYGTDEDGCGPECQGTCSSGETAVGIIQWTSLVSKNMNNIGTQFIPGCLEINSSLCAPLVAYKDWSEVDFWNDYNSGTREFEKVLSQICDTDRDGFLGVQMELAKKQYLDPILEEYPWLKDRPSCVQGAVMHLKVWGASYSWLSNYVSSSDEEIVLKVRNTIANTGSTAGAATGNEGAGRAYNEPQIALEILSGAVSTDEVEKWVRNRDTSVFNFNFK